MSNMLEPEQLHIDFGLGSPDYSTFHPFPTTRFQGSKYKITDWIWENIKFLSFHSALDAFGGTGSVSHMLKQKGKQIVYNDILKFNYIIGKALIENKGTKLNERDIKFILTKDKNINYPTFIQDKFNGIFYLERENEWLDYVITNIRRINNEYKQALAWYSLFQSCIAKRPYNLFHRANLNIRTADVKRGFGNKSTWDKPFEEHFIDFANEANKAVFNNGQNCMSINYDALDIPDNMKWDLVYIDTPYITSKGVGTDYLDFYHFLEGMLDYDNWDNHILNNYKHLPLKGRGQSPWIKKDEIYNAFDSLFNKYQDSIIVVSYRDDGIPTVHEILDLLGKYKKNVIQVSSREYQYVLSNKKSSEVLFIAE